MVTERDETRGTPSASPTAFTASSEASGSPRAAPTSAQIRALRARAHALKPVVQVGKAGLSDGVVASVDQALDDHELVKVRLLRNCPVDRHEAAAELAARTRSVLVQVLGNHVTLYRPRPDGARTHAGTRRKRDTEQDVQGP